MEVILKTDVKGKGKKDQLVKVSDGYARNFLFPRGLAVEATKESLSIMSHKKCVPIVTSGENIMWIGNMRRDSRFEISPSTRKILKIKLWEGLDKNGE